MYIYVWICQLLCVGDERSEGKEKRIISCVCICVDYHIDRFTEACVMNEGLKASTKPTIYLQFAERGDRQTAEDYKGQ